MVNRRAEPRKPGCDDLPASDVYACAQTNCGASYVYYEWLSVFQCFTGTCADSCY
jgi:hypothetical protein